MKKRILIWLLAGNLLLLAYRAAAGPLDSITVTNADTIRSLLVGGSASLESKLDAVIDRIVLLYANNVRFINLTAAPLELNGKLDAVDDRVIVNYGNNIRFADLVAAPGELDAKLTAVPDRVVLNYGNTVRFIPLSPIPGALNTALNGVANRLVILAANTNRAIPLRYPKELINDTVKPRLLQTPTATRVAADSLEIRWMTNEYARFEFRYGTSPGNYPNLIEKQMFNLSHSVILSGLVEDQTYYYRISHYDLSGNRGNTAEYSFELVTEEYLYLPMILR